MYKVYLLETIDIPTISTTQTSGFDVNDLTAHSVPITSSSIVLYNDAPDFEISGIYSDGVSSNFSFANAAYHSYSYYPYSFSSDLTIYLRFGYRNKPIALIQYRGGVAINTYFTTTDPTSYNVTFTGVSGMMGDIFVITTNVLPIGSVIGTTQQTSQIELDTEAIDIQTVFSISTISDLSQRKDTITKTVVFKGTKTNNKAFGSLFHLNRNSDIDLSNKLFFNYSSLRPVDCLVYEDTFLLFTGALSVLQVVIDANDNITYETVITGKVIDFKNAISEKYLTDLDMTDLQHRNNQKNVLSSMGLESSLTDYPANPVSIEVYNPTTSTYGTQLFELGKGYLYSFIDYGHLFKNTTDNNNDAKIPFQNFRAGVYVTEYLDRIFAGTSYTYEIKGSTTFKENFKRLVVPNADDTFKNRISGSVINDKVFKLNTQFTLLPLTGPNTSFGFLNPSYGVQIRVPFNSSNNNNSLIGYNANQYDYDVSQNVKTLFNTKRSFTSDANVKLTLSAMKNNSTVNPFSLSIQLVERDFVLSTSNDFNSLTNWTVISEKNFSVPINSTLPETTHEFYVPLRKFESNKQIMLRLFVNLNSQNGELDATTNLTYKYAELNIPATDTSLVEYEISSDNEVVKPKAPENVKQFDFVKSLMSLFNFYLYAKKERPNHLIFERYDDFYALAQPQYLKDALIWTNKIDYKSERKIKQNVTIPKTYNFTYKVDKDLFNDTYYKKYSQVYGSYKINDSLGTGSEKKVELVFSPSPQYQSASGKRFFPAIYGVDGTNKKTITSNIRILYYNGLRDCNSYKVYKDVFNSTTNTYSISQVWTGIDDDFKLYPLVSSYLYDSSLNPIEDLNFNYPFEIYFNSPIDYTTVTTAFSNYQNLINDITNPNTLTIECFAYLNEIDINNLDLKVPVFVSMSGIGSAYFKVLNVEYKNNMESSFITLQKIV